jgi:hypothetical protein
LRHCNVARLLGALRALQTIASAGGYLGATRDKRLQRAAPVGDGLRATLTEPLKRLKTVLLWRVYGPAKKALIKARIRGQAHKTF